MVMRGSHNTRPQLLARIREYEKEVDALQCEVATLTAAAQASQPSPPPSSKQ